LQSIFFWLPYFSHGQSPVDTLVRYDGDRFLIRQSTRFELRDNKGVIDWWENMSDNITLDNKTYHLIKRKEGDKWKTGLFRRSEGKLLIPPRYEQVSSFFQSSHLVILKGYNGFFLYSIKNGNKTRDGFESFRRFGNDCLAFNSLGMFIYNEQLELKDSLDCSFQPATQQTNGKREYIFLRCKEGNVLLDDKYQRSVQTDWKSIIRLEGNLLLVESELGQGIYHLGQKRLLTSLDHKPYLYELHETKFILFKDSNYILYDTTGRILTKVMARGMSCVEDLRAFFYLQNNFWKIINADGKVLKTPNFDDFDQSKAPIGQFIARTKGETKRKRYAWVYTETNGQKTITGIKLIGEYKENEPISNWPPNQPVPVDAKQKN
jgi:hypothetical protein